MTKKFHFSYIGITGVFILAFFVTTLGVASGVYAASDLKHGQRLVTIHDRGVEKSVITRETTLRNVFKEANIIIDPNDMVEPGLDETLEGDSYQVNVYRARPITVIDGNNKIRVMSAHQTPQQIAQHAGFVLHDEDITKMRLPDDPLADDMNLQLTIDRATPVKLVLYGKSDTVYTQAATIEAFLIEKKIQLAKNDILTVKPTTPIESNMKIEIWRNGKQTITRDEAIDFAVQRIEDADKKVGYRKITTPGIKGKKKVTYEVVMKNGKELKRKKIQSVVLERAKKQVEVVGTKPNFDGDFAAALAKLRACEGGYDSWNPAGPYYGAYQFDQGTWYGVTDAPYGKATPAEQDAAARKLYERRGWSPWPVCGASLPDTYR
ncbi:MAG TPA: G5 domain-containing protein [Candidatus Saccharimonadales bacterium]